MKIPFGDLFKPSPAPPGFGEGKILPEGTSPLLSKLIFQWLGPFLEVGYSRPLEKEDFWELPKARLTATITDDVERNFYARCPPEKRPRHIRARETTPGEKSVEEHGGLTPPADILTAVSTQTTVPPDAELDKELAAKPSVIPPTRSFVKPWTWFSRKKEAKPEFDESLFKAIHTTFFVRIWVGGALKLFSDTLKTTTPLVTKVLLTWLTESYIYVRATDAEREAFGLNKPRGIGYGIGVAIGLFVMQEAASLMTNHYQQTALTTGLSVRTGIIGSVFRKSLRLSGKARVNHSVGQITTMISTDATRLDRFSAFCHNLWVSPIQLAIGIGLLLGNLGYSALVGLGVLMIGFPLQFALVKVMFTQRKKGVKITDKRQRLTTEVLQGIRLIKFYAWEEFYSQQIGELRRQEIKTIRKSAIARSLLIAIVVFIPVLASTLSFITYALSGHDLNIAIIFSSLQLFNIIRAPLIFFPFVFSALSDALVALGRIGTFLTSEDLPEPYPIDSDAKAAIEVDGDFAWETVFNPSKADEGKFGKGAGGRPGAGGPGAGRGKGSGGKDGGKARTKPKAKPQKDESAGGGKWWQKSAKKGGKGGDVLPSTTKDLEKDSETGSMEKDTSSDDGKAKKKDKEEEKPFELNNLKFTVPQGSFVGIVGRVGCGKSSVLQALIGEMRRTRGTVRFGGNVSYAPQTPWIRNATLRENILFGQPDDEDRFRNVISACCLDHDLEVLPNGEQTEIGEKGINLSGGQKARVSLARAAYSDSDIVLLDDPLSAVDAYVGKSILENCLLSGPLSDRTRVLVTHALHVLDKTDYIYVMDNGVIIEQGTYQDLMMNSQIFSRLMDEYGNLEVEEEEQAKSDAKKKNKGDKSANGGTEGGGMKKGNPALMQLEERNTGAVTWSVYKKYLGFAGGVVWAPVIVLLLTLTQGAQVGNNLFLGFWTANSIHGFKQGDYMAVYAALGMAQAVFQFILSFSFAIASLIASLNLFRTALRRVLRSPISFFDTTPMGRILSRLSKDQDTLDTELSMTLMQFLSTFSSVIGTVALVFYTFPYLGIIFAPLSILYYIVASYYRRSSVETKRLDSLMRSILYGSFTETLTGLATIRAYREQERSIKDAERGLDLENRAYYMTISIQRWLAVRLDVFGNVLILGIGLFAAGFRHSVNPSKIGVVLSYTLSITQSFSDMVSQFAQNEQNMNAVERVLHYSELEPEGDLTTPNDPPPSWPSEGGIRFEDVELAYREGLPLVLKGISFQIKPGEKVGIIGRTGAGKSSLLQALFRTVELKGGKIEIDGRNIREVGLDVLRSRLALVPQDGTLFLGTLRENIDPQGLRTDAELISALQRSWLLPKSGPPDPVAEAKFSLDSTVGDEGSANFSAGEKQLLALCRALVKNSKIIVLDEATSNVDVETDAKLQRTIQVEFASSTLLCIAHRLNTIAYYDRVIVMDEGKVAEFDTVLNLFDNETSIFRSLCDEANLQRADIVRIRAEHDIMIQS
ncbi:ABC-type transporter cicA [Psilocybe cubensis]|uniref:ABC-type transporter cicA n=2 Tax=Psilocybe cubensis TaxID=181762 RepID=A0ACB8GLW8_PSICU|nr:ABC-type transporter cicA [Psilocybe cubensis]KAH9476201.1 ABC-type transporter cicA [Psilocybe cubensis]